MVHVAAHVKADQSCGNSVALGVNLLASPPPLPPLPEISILASETMHVSQVKKQQRQQLFRS